MYDLGDVFKFDLNKSTANKDCIFKGEKYRITILTERLVRIEYNDNGIFEDNPTECIWYRNFSKPNFTVEDNNKILKITTKYFTLNYIKNKSFKSSKFSSNKPLSIMLNDTGKYWYYDHPEVRKYETISSGIDIKNKKNSLYSLDGFVSIDDSKSSIILENGTFKKRDNNDIDTYVFMYGKDFYYCLNDYFMITGYPPLVPKYALGNWWSKDEFYSEIDVSRFIKKFEDNNIPISVFILNKWQMDNNYQFTSFYKDFKSMVDYIKSKKIKLGLQLFDHLDFKSNTDAFNKIKTYLTLDKNGNIPFNLYDSRTIDAYLKLLIHPLSDLGVDFYSIESKNKNINLERLNILNHYLYKDNFKKENKRHLISSYNSSLIPHRYPILYSGKIDVSWDSLKKIPAYNVSATHMGVSFLSTDIGGSNGGVEDNELFTRFVQLGVFSPILRLGSDEGKYYKREPWKWGLKTKQITTEYLNLRYKLIPYIYTESYKYFKYGKPLLEPIYYRYPQFYDDLIYKDDYFFGSNFFISPITTKKDYVMNRVIHKLYMPKGIWFDFFTGKRYKGDKKYTTFYKDEEYPVFVKAGSIIPMSLNKFNDISSPKDMEIQVFPGDSNTYSIYEDDGETNNYLNGEYLITNIEYLYKKNSYSLTILPVQGKTGCIPKTRNYKIRFRNTKPINNISSYVGNTKILNNYYRENNDLVIEVSEIPTNQQLTIILSGQDMEIDALRIINEDLTSIISDLPIKTSLKQKLDNIIFSSEFDIKKKRIQIRKLGHEKDYLEQKYINLFLKLLEYINEV